MSCNKKNITRLIQDGYRSPILKFNSDISVDTFTLNIYQEFGRVLMMGKDGIFAPDGSIYFSEFELPTSEYYYEIIRIHNGKPKLILSGEYNVTKKASECSCESSDVVNFTIKDGDEVFNFAYSETVIIGGDGGFMTDLQIKTAYERNSNTNAYTDDEKAKLAGLENYDDSQILGELAEKVDKIDGFGLSETNFSQAEKDKLAGIKSNLFKGKFPSVSALNLIIGESGAYAYVGIEGENDKSYIWDDDDNIWVQNSSEGTAETPSSVKSKYESNPDTNAFTDALKIKLENLFNYNDTLLWNAVTNKVDKESGKGLSANDFTNTLKTKLDGISANANNYTLPQATATTLGGLKIWSGTQNAYDAIATKDATVFYFIEKV
ncbi:head fiber protein [Epilithonimonas xixisoli]|uniref:Head fiber protein n=1 Tax=Epilithonimonas xixisoli TaxID=1476462 RepID=A0A4R8I9R7_9FLAO|nr:head fiber protein [Epilithonimonas xixisoli]TDX84001.1 head fiber protein [Epilithonimonas xixisoli]